jgi:hypothetical protein
MVLRGTSWESRSSPVRDCQREGCSVKMWVLETPKGAEKDLIRLYSLARR